MQIQQTTKPEATRILIAEDDEFMRRSVATFLRKKGYRPLEAGNGEEALEIFRMERPHLILTDLRMPVMDGFDLLEQIIIEAPETPVIIFSGVGDKPDIITAMRSGAWDYITKPIDIDFLMERIERALVQAQMTYGYNDTMENALKKSNAALKRELAEKQQLEKMIIHAKREWERTVDALQEMIALIDSNHCFIRVNKAMAARFGKVQPELTGKTCFLSTGGFDDRDRAEQDFQAIFTTGETRNGRFHDPKTACTFEVNITPYFDMDDRTVLGAVFIARNISDK